MQESYIYGLGIVLSGGWLPQNQLFLGTCGVVAYHLAARVAIADSATFTEDAFDASGAYSNSAQTICARIGSAIVPADPLLIG